MKSLDILEKEVREELNQETEQRVKGRIKSILCDIRAEQVNIEGHQAKMKELQERLKDIEIKTVY